MRIKSLFISDVHLGSINSQANKLLDVLKEYEFDNLFIIGDFIDMTSLKRKYYWNKDHSTVIQKILRESRKGKNVTYIIGKILVMKLLILFYHINNFWIIITHLFIFIIIVYYT